MLNQKMNLLFSSIIVVLCMTLALSFVYATQTETITVDAGYQEQMVFDLEKGDKFSGSLSVSGGSGNDVDFWVTDPNGNTIINSGRVSQGRTFDFTAQKSGAYTLHFDNSFSIFSSKTVSLSYDVERELIPSITPESSIWIALVFAVICVVTLAAVGMYVFLRRSKNGPPIPPPPPP